MASRRWLGLLTLLCLAGALTVQPVLAGPPPLPSSFYGQVTLNGAPVADGTVIQASIDGQVYATAQTSTYNGTSVYALDVPGDISGTASKEGGVAGDVVHFTIAGQAALQTGVWSGSTNVELNLVKYQALLPVVLRDFVNGPTTVATQTAVAGRPESVARP